MECLFGKEYLNLTNDKRMSIYKRKTSFEINKNTFLNDIYDNIGTIKSSYITFKNNVIPLEKSKNKDLMYFSSGELQSLFLYLPTSSQNTKKRLYDVTNLYLDWCLSRGYIEKNNLRVFSSDYLCKVSIYKSRDKVISKEKLFDLCEKSLAKGDITVMEVIPLIIARYGIVGKDLSRIINLKWKDIDEEKMIVTIKEGKYKLIFPIDEDFIKWIRRAKDVHTDGKYRYYDEGNVIKVISNYKGASINSDYIYNKVIKVFSLGILPRISFRDLELSYKFDILLNTRKDRVLTSRDFRDLVTRLNPKASPAATNILIKTWENITQIDKVTLRCGKNKIIDNTPFETAKEIEAIIGYTG